MFTIKFEKAQKELGNINISDVQNNCEKFIVSVLQQIYYNFSLANSQIEEKFHDLKKSTFLNNLILEYNKDYLIVYKKLLAMVYENSEIMRFKGDNCFTWIREKMKIIDIQLEEKYWDKIIANPKWYTKKID